MNRFLSGLRCTLVIGIALSAAFPALAQLEDEQGPQFSLRGHLAPLFFLGTERRIGDHGNLLSLQLRLRRLVVSDPGFGGSDGVFGFSFAVGLGRDF